MLRSEGILLDPVFVAPNAVEFRGEEYRREQERAQGPEQV